MDKTNLFRDSHFTHDTGDYDCASDSSYPDASATRSIYPSSPDRALDFSDVALCFSNGCDCLPDAIPLLSWSLDSGGDAGRTSRTNLSSFIESSSIGLHVSRRHEGKNDQTARSFRNARRRFVDSMPSMAPSAAIRINDRADQQLSQSQLL